MRLAGEFGLQVGLRASTHAGAGGIAALCHETGDDTVEDDAVVETVAGKLGNPFDMARREVGAKLDHDVAAGRKGQGQGVGVGHETSPDNGYAAAFKRPARVAPEAARP